MPAPGSVRTGLFPTVKHWYVVLAVGLLNALLLLLLINIALYAIMRFRHPAPPITARFSDHFDPEKLQQAYPGWSEDKVKAMIRETPRADREFEYEPMTGFRERPFRGRFVNVDSAGFRYSKDQAPWPPQPENRNVFIFGGSTAFGYFLPDDETIPSHLQEIANTSDSKTKWAIYNFARPAYFSSQELILFQQLLRDGHVPQVAVFIDGLNEFIFADGDPKFTAELRSFMDGKTESNPLQRLPMVDAYHRLEAHLHKPPASAGNTTSEPNYADPTLVREVAERWLANRKMIESIGKAYGVRVLFVWQPVPMYEYDLRYHFFLHDEKAFGGFIRAKYGYALMDGMRRSFDGDVLWLAGMQQDKHENLYVDSVHYNDAFSKEIAAKIWNTLNPQLSGN